MSTKLKLVNNAIGWSVSFGYIGLLETCFRLHVAEMPIPGPRGFFVLICICASLNMLSHTAVVIGVLNDTYAVNILLGVGFDVATTVLYLTMWREILALNTVLMSTTPLSFFLGIVCLLITALQWLTHVRALLLSYSAARLKSVVKVALNNVCGEPEPAYVHHLFAFTDTAYHMFHTMVAMRLLGWRQGLITFAALTIIVATGFVVSNGGKSPPKKKLPPNILKINKEGRLVCSCDVCKGENKAFSIDLLHGKLCAMWFQSFGQLCGMLDDLDKKS